MNAWEAFREAGVNALNKIADKLMSMAADQLWSAAFPGGGIGGGLGGLFSLFGGGGGGGVATGAASLFALYDEGGYTGPGARFAPAGVVHKGEYVFSAPSVSRIGVGNLERLHRGYADGGLVDGSVPQFNAGTRGDPGGGVIRLEVTATIDKNGNIVPLVRDVAGQVAGQAVSLAAPGIARQAVSEVQSRNKRDPGFVRSV